MNAIPYDGPEEEWDSYEDEQEVALPGRPRHKVLTWWSAGLFAVLLGLVGFYVGVRVEKHQLANSSSTSGFAAALAGAGAGTGATAPVRPARGTGATRGRVPPGRVPAGHARRRRWRRRLPRPVRRRGRWKRVGRDGLEHQRRLALRHRDFG